MDQTIMDQTIVNQTVANRYLIKEELGRGGFAVSYRAVDLLTNAIVTVKKLLDMRVKADFLREAGILRELKDVPHIARYVDDFCEGEHLYLVMRYIEGNSLMELSKKKGKLPKNSELTVLCADIAESLSMMHKKGFLHRDVSPGNLILTPARELYLIDFGAATSLDPTSSLRNANVFTHKGFEAPETLAFDLQGPWTDIYSLCATMLFLFIGEGIPTPQMRRDYDAVPQLIARSGAPAYVQNALLRGLRMEAGKRYLDASELALALRLRNATALANTRESRTFTANFAYRTYVGNRNVNQDNFVVDWRHNHRGEDCSDAGVIEAQAGSTHLIAVCDGAGGANYSELASKATAQALIHFLENYGTCDGLPERLIERLLDQMNEKIISLGTKIGKTATTVSVVMWRDDDYYAFNIGDSPIYHLHKGRLKKLSVGHTRAHLKMMTGEMPTASDLHVLMNYLGKEGVAGSDMASICHGKITPGDTFLVCSDGVTNKVGEAAIRYFLQVHKTRAIKHFWRKIEQSGLNDNCTAVIVYFPK